MHPPRVEPYVGTSSPHRAASPDTGSLHSAYYLDTDGQERPVRVADDYITATMQPDPGEPTIDITITDLPRPDVAPDPAVPRAVAADDAAERDISVGATLRNRYVLHRLIGTGGTCRVFLAEDLHRRLSPDASGELLALKVLRPGLRRTAHSLQRLRREFLQMQQLTHASITRVFDLDCDGDLWFMTMELVDAHSALSWMEGSYSNAEATRLILSCCEAVAYAHRKGIIHGDLKPGNVLVSGDGSIKLIDFGSVAGASEPEEASAKLEATPQYASPSVLSGNMAEASDDVFGLGCLAYMILSRGRHPFDRKPSLEAARSQLRPAYIPGIPLRLFEVVVRALAWDPAHRQATVRELQHALIASELTRVPSAYRAKPQAPAQSSDPPAAAAAPAEDLAEIAARPPVQPEPPPQPASEHSDTSTGQPDSDAEENVKGDYSYLSKFRGYVAGPLRDSKLRRAMHDASAAIIGRDHLCIPTATLASRPKAKRHQPVSPAKRAAVNVMGMMLVLASALTAALLSRRPEPQRERTASHVRNVMVPVLTIPTPNIEPVPMPSVRIAASAEPKPTRRRAQPAPAQANPAASSMVSFEARAVEVSPTQKLVAIPIRRTDSSRGAVRVAWKVEGDRARQLVDSGRAGSQVIQFHEGQTTRTLYVPLRKEAAELVADGVRTFQVKLRKVDDGPDPGRVAEVRVTLLGR